MTALLITAYLAVTVFTGRAMWQALTTRWGWDANDPDERVLGGILSLMIGLFWPITLPALALIRIIIGPHTPSSTTEPSTPTITSQNTGHSKCGRCYRTLNRGEDRWIFPDRTLHGPQKLTLIPKRGTRLVVCVPCGNRITTATLGGTQ